MLSELLSNASIFLSDLIATFGYTGIFIATFIENIIAPIPSEFIFPLAGYLASQGKMNIWLISLAGGLGSLLAALLLYFIGSKFNTERSRHFVDKWGKYIFVSLQDIEKAEKWFTKYGVWTILIFRLVPLGRTVVSIPAGFTKMNIMTFSILTFIGTFLWCFILTYLGFLMVENWKTISNILSEYEHIVIYAIILGIIGFLYIKRKQLAETFRMIIEKLQRRKISR